MKPTPPVMEITSERAEEAIARLTAVCSQNAELAPHLRIALCGLESYLKVVRFLARKGVSIKDLRRQLGITSEDDDSSAPQSARTGTEPGKKRKPKRHEHGRRGSKDFPNADHRFFAHPDFDEPGTLCPGCERGHLYPSLGAWHRFHGQPLLRVTIVHHEIWRCTLCAQSFPAPIAQDIIADGKPGRPFGNSAIALIAISKYFFGTPWCRQERMQNMLELPISASTLLDQTATMAESASPVYECLRRFAANAWRFLSDDTGVKILKQAPIVKEQRKTGKETLRTGVHTSTILADLKQSGRDIRIILYESGILHAGEFLDELLKDRDEGLPPPLHMSDGSSCNPATVTKTIECNCNAHGLRKLREKCHIYPEHWEIMRLVYRDVKRNDAHVRETGMDDEARLAYHREHSKPKLEEMFTWMQRELDQKNVEPNSQLGAIFGYFLERQTKLMAFTEHAGAPITSNEVEQAIKYVALHRKNAGFFMTARGAWIADVILSVGATAGKYGVNIYDYFTALLCYREEVRKDPSAFLPWEYQKTVARLKEVATRAPPQPRAKELTATQWQERQTRIKEIRARLRDERLHTLAA